MPNLKRDHFFHNEVATAPLLNFTKYVGSSTEETSISARIWPDAVMTIAIEFLTEFVTASLTQKQNADQEADVQSFDVVMRISTKRRAVSLESLRKLRILFPIAMSNLLTFYSKHFHKFCTSSSENKLSELTKPCVEAKDERMRNSHLERTVCFIMQDTTYNLICLTAHFFSDLFCD